MDIIEIRIGRNVGSVPMSDGRWDYCLGRCVAALQGVVAGVNRGRLEDVASWTEIHRGTGTWHAEDGTVVTEESAVVSLYVDASLVDLFPFRDALVADAAELAGEFEQDAVAVVWQGTSTLVGSAVKA